MDSLEQPHQKCDGGFQDAIGRGARQSHVGFLSHERLDEMTFQCHFQPGLFYGSMNTSPDSATTAGT